MTLTFGIIFFLGVVALVTSLLVYYFKAIRPKEEAQFYD